MVKEVFGNGGDDQGIVLDIDGEDFIFSMDTAPSLPDLYLDACFRPSPSPTSPSSSSSSLSPSPTFVLDSSANSAFTGIFADLDKIDGWDSSSTFSDDCVVIGERKPAPTCHDVIRGGNGEGEDLGKFFLEWLKNNKDYISPEDLRSVKLKRSTVACAARRLGGGKEGRKQLLKLILDWVQHHHLQKKKSQQQPEWELFPLHQQQQQQMFVSSPISYPISVDQQVSVKPDAGLGFSSKSKHVAESPWIPNTSYVLDSPALTPLMVNSSAAADLGSAPASPYANDASNGSAVSSRPFSLNVDYRIVDPASSWQPASAAAQFVPSTAAGALAAQPPSQVVSSFPGQKPYRQEDRVMKSASATKEARRKRMERQRRSATPHQNYV